MSLQIKRIIAVLIVLTFFNDFIAHFDSARRNAWTHWYSLYRAWAITTRYASPTGSGSTCSSPSPCTLATAKGQMAGGDITILKAGVYGALEAWDPPAGTTPDYTTFRSETPRTAIVRAAPGDNFALQMQTSNEHHIEFDGIVFDGVAAAASGVVKLTYSGASLTNNAHHIRFRNVEIFGNPLVNNCLLGGSDDPDASWGLEVYDSYFHHCSYGMYWGAKNATVKRTRFEDLDGFAAHIYCYSSTCRTDGLVFSENKIKRYSKVGCWGGIVFARGSGADIYNNEFSEGAITGCGTSNAVQLFDGSSNARVYGNTIYNNVGPCVSTGAFHSGSTIRNNVCVGTTGIQDLGSGNTVSDNTIDSLGSAASHFADAANGDFRLCTGKAAPHANCSGISSAIDAGATLGAPYNVDIVGTSRPQGGAWDRGAWESGGTGAPSCPTTPALVARYTFEGNAQDNSGNANHGTHGGGVTYAAGKYGQGAVFGGAEAIAVADAASLWLCVGYTIAGWIKPSTAPGDFTTLVSKRNLATGQGVFVYSRSHPDYCSGSGGPLAGYTQITNAFNCYTIPFTVGVFAYYAETWDGTTLRKYINGTLITSLGASAILDPNADTMLIGGSVYGEFFTGVIDEVIVLNCALGGSVVNPACAPVGAPSTIVAAMNTGAGNMVSNKFGVVARKFAGGITRKFGFVP